LCPRLDSAAAGLRQAHATIQSRVEDDVRRLHFIGADIDLLNKRSSYDACIGRPALIERRLGTEGVDARINGRTMAQQSMGFRQAAIVSQWTEQRANIGMDLAGGDLPLAIVMAKTGCELNEAKQALNASSGVVTKAIEVLQK